jgi:cytochrome P450
MHKGEVIIAAIHHIHNNPKVWENPDRFDPDRWDSERVKKRGRADYIPYVRTI